MNDYVALQNLEVGRRNKLGRVRREHNGLQQNEPKTQRSGGGTTGDAGNAVPLRSAGISNRKGPGGKNYSQGKTWTKWTKGKTTNHVGLKKAQNGHGALPKV